MGRRQDTRPDLSPDEFVPGVAAVHPCIC